MYIFNFLLYYFVFIIKHHLYFKFIYYNFQIFINIIQDYLILIIMHHFIFNQFPIFLIIIINYMLHLIYFIIIIYY